MSVTPNLAGFYAASQQLRQTFGDQITFSVPQADTHRQAIAAAQEFFARTLAKAP